MRGLEMTKSEQDHLYYLRNKERIKARTKAYREAHPEETKAYMKAYWSTDEYKAKQKVRRDQRDKKQTHEYMTNWRLRKFCSEYEKIDNYELAKADNFVGWDVHHRMEVTSHGALFSRAELIRKGLYYNQMPCMLVFMKTEDHHRLHAIASKLGGRHNA